MKKAIIAIAGAGLLATACASDPYGGTNETVRQGAIGAGIGAVAGAIDNVRLGNLTLLLARFGNAIAATPYDGVKSGKNTDYVDKVAATQVRQTLTLIRERSPVLRGLETEGKIRIVGSMYDLKTGRVSLLDEKA